MHKRHGDLLIRKIDSLPKGVRSQKGKILAKGETTGHAHTIEDAKLYGKQGTLYFKVEESKVATLTHQEHDTLTFDPGIYEVIRQREYDGENIRRVVD